VCSSDLQYAREVFPKATFLKLSMTYPLPRKLIRKFAAQVKKIVVVEELDPYLEENLLQMGIPVEGKSKVPQCGELSTEVVAKAFGEEQKPFSLPVEVPIRFPVLCPGCSHAPVYYTLKTLKATVTGDIGCYTLGGMPPLSSMDTCICMGASVGMALGLEKALGRDAAKRIVATIGDSTFLHSGITGLLDIVYNKGVSTVCILNNSTTAMTGHQDHAGTGKTLSKEETHKVDFAALCRGLGIKDVKVVDPYNLKALREAFKDSLSRPEPSVVIADRPCVLLERKKGKPVTVDMEKCNACGLCFLLGCPAMEKAKDKPEINEVFCVGCNVCAEICNRDAILAL
jgi:indolepyruvate ferredoxin oxidoreductase alpha subunit